MDEFPKILDLVGDSSSENKNGHSNIFGTEDSLSMQSSSASGGLEVMIGGSSVPPFVVLSKEQEKRSYNSLWKDLEPLLYTDVVKLITVDKVEFPFHKRILAARSTYFANKFQPASESELSECPCPDNNVNITGLFSNIMEIPVQVKSTIMEIIVDYIYTGKLKKLQDTILNLDQLIDLASASDQFGLKYLKELCDQVMAKKCNVNNACRIHKVATKLDLKLTTVGVHNVMKRKLCEISDDDVLQSLQAFDGNQSSEEK